jgi:hypothetical protein
MRVKKRTLSALIFCFGLQPYNAYLTIRPGHKVHSPNSFLKAYQGKIHHQDFDINNSKQQDNQHSGKRRHGGLNYSNSNDRRDYKQQRRTYLEQATDDILITEPGSLGKGKWHELVSMLRAWSKYTKDDPEAPLVIERLLKRLLDERQLGKNPEAKADIRMYNILLDAWACSALFRTQDPSIASQRAREILVLLQETFENEADRDLMPNAYSFDVVFHAVLKMEGPIKARRILAWMEHLYKVRKNVLAKPRRNHYMMLLHAYSNSQDGNAGILAEGFIRHMNVTGVQKPETYFYNIAIKAWTRAKRGRESAEHADRILEEMQAPKDLVTYSTVISAWAASGMRSHAIARAEQLLREIEETPDLEPNTVVLNTVMSTWVKSRNPAAANRTEEMLQHMETSEIAPPDLISYNTHLHALSIHAKRPGYARRADDLLMSLEERHKTRELSFRPNLFTYNLVIDAWSKSQEYDAAWNAVKVLRKLIDDGDGKPDPDTFSFNQVLSALSRSSKPGAARLAEQLLNYMKDAYRMRIHRNARPDVIGYTSVIVALARSGEKDAVERAERLFNNMKERYAKGERYMKPSRNCFNALIDCWAKSGKGTFAARKAEALLEEMNEMYLLGDTYVAPNIVTYNAVLNSWARSGTRCCANKAEDYLERMLVLYNSGEGKIAPNDKSFNTVRSNIGARTFMYGVDIVSSLTFSCFFHAGHQCNFKKPE